MQCEVCGYELRGTPGSTDFRVEPWSQKQLPGMDAVPLSERKAKANDQKVTDEP